MRRSFFLFLLLCFAVPSLFAQGGFTTVTGTITGPDGLVWACGTISAQLITAGGASPTLNGGGFTTHTSPVSLGCPTTPGTGAPGSFAMRLADSGVIVPSNTTWQFTVNMTPGIAPPAGTGPQSFTFTTAINCGTNTPSTCTSNTISITSQLSAAAPKLSNGSGGSLAVKNSGLSGSNVIYPNASPYNISFDGKVCIGIEVSWPNASTAVNCFSGASFPNGSAVLTSNVVTITFPATFPFNPVTAGWKTGDTIVVAGLTGGDTFFNGTFTIATVTATTVTYNLTHANGTSSTAGQITDSLVGPFLPIDSTKVGFGTNCSTGGTACVATSATRPIGAVTYVSATQVNVAGNSTAGCTAPGCQFWWFTDDRPKWGPGTTVGTVQWALENAQGCVSIVSPAGVSPIPFGLFNNSNPTCGQTTSAAFGNLLSSTDIGNTVWGQGMGATIFLLPPDSDFTKCTGFTGTLCLWVGISGGGNFTIHGGGNGLTGTNNKIIWAPNQNASFFDNISLTQFGSGDLGNLIGAQFVFANKYEGIYVDQFGAFPCQLNGQNVILSYYSCGDSRQIPMTIAGSGTVAHISNGYQQATLGSEGIDVTSNTTLFSVQDNSYGSTTGTHVFVETGATAHFEQWQNLNGTNFGFQLAAGGKLHLRNSFVNGTTHCIGTNGVTLTTGGFFNEGGNTCNGGAMESTVLPSCPTTTGLGTGSCATANTQGDNSFDLVLSPTGAPGNTGTVTITLAGTYQVNSGILPTLTCGLASGTGTWGNTSNVAVSTRSATLPVVTWTNSTNGTAGALAAGSTYVISCQLQAN